MGFDERGGYEVSAVARANIGDIGAALRAERSHVRRLLEVSLRMRGAECVELIGSDFFKG